MSLRTRLFILTAVSFIALLIAIFSGWRTAQMSQTFALRQAESSVSGALRELENQADDAQTDKRRKPKRGELLPHEREIYARYDDDLTRKTALALNHFENVSGGFCVENGKPSGVISSDSSTNKLSNDESQIAQSVCSQILSAKNASTQKINIGENVLLVASAPIDFENDNADKIIGAFALRNLPQNSMFGDAINLVTQGFLLIAAVGLAAFSLMTLRDWQRGMNQIERGLSLIANDLRARINAPRTFELARISNSINDLAANLDANLHREAELKQSLARNEKLASLGRVAAGVAHEVRNPLTAMKLKIQLTQRANFAPEKTAKTFGVLLEEIERLDVLVKRLLEISRPMKFDVDKISLTEIIENRFALMSETATNQNVQVTFSQHFTYDSIRANREKLSQVFDNLFRNALEAMPNGGELKIDLTENADVLRVEISDSGDGINCENREQIFEPFFTTRDEGTGLGLAISREIIEQHNGKIYLLSDSKETTFVIEIPKTK